MQIRCNLWQSHRHVSLFTQAVRSPQQLQVDQGMATRAYKNYHTTQECFHLKQLKLSSRALWVTNSFDKASFVPPGKLRAHVCSEQHSFISSCLIHTGVLHSVCVDQWEKSSVCVDQWEKSSVCVDQSIRGSEEKDNNCGSLLTADFVWSVRKTLLQLWVRKCWLVSWYW